MFVVQVTVLSPLSSYPSLQLRDRTVPVEIGNSFSAFMLVQVVFRPVQPEFCFVTLHYCNIVSKRKNIGLIKMNTE